METNLLPGKTLLTVTRMEFIPGTSTRTYRTYNVTSTTPDSVTAGELTLNLNGATLGLMATDSSIWASVPGEMDEVLFCY